MNAKAGLCFCYPCATKSGVLFYLSCNDFITHYKGLLLEISKILWLLKNNCVVYVVGPPWFNCWIFYSGIQLYILLGSLSLIYLLFIS